MRWHILLSTGLIFLTIILGYVVERSNFLLLIGSYALFFIIYWFIFSRIENPKYIRFYIAIGILVRIILLFSLPNLSEDCYRFIWDGRLIINGLNPFDQLPSYYIENKILPEILTPTLYESLNSKIYFTIYPPIAQGIFAIACWIFPKSILGSIVIMKLILLVAEIGSILLIIKLLQKLKLPEKNVLLYSLNPLVIIEIVGNVHFEGLLLFFLLLSLWLLVKLNWVGSAIMMAFAIASKLIPLIFLPFLIAKLGLKKNIFYFLILGITLLILFSLLLNSLFINHFGESLNLYFQQFEFNASVYYIARWIGYQIEGHNLIVSIGPVLAILTFLSIITLALQKRKEDLCDLPKSWLFTISIYLLFATTVHPWYLTLLVALSVFTKWRYAMIWSGVVILSYSHYWHDVFKENYGLIVIEYVVVIAFVGYEFFAKNSKKV